jgi:hypothetical protein
MLRKYSRAAADHNDERDGSQRRNLITKDTNVVEIGLNETPAQHDEHQAHINALTYTSEVNNDMPHIQQLPQALPTQRTVLPYFLEVSDDENQEAQKGGPGMQTANPPHHTANPEPQHDDQVVQPDD